MGAGETLPWTGAQERLWSQKASERPACGSCPTLGPAPRPQQGAGRLGTWTASRGRAWCPICLCFCLTCSLSVSVLLLVL